jgi:hypothetical protein
MIANSVPALGEVKLGDLTPELIRAWYAALRKRRTASTAARAYTRLRQILGQAITDDRIAKERLPDSRRRGRTPPRATVRVLG